MLTLLVAACFSKEAPGPAAAEPSAEAVEPASVERAVLIDEEGGEHPTWKVKAGVDLARDLVGELAVQSCLEHLDMGYDTCALKKDCLLIVLSEEEGEISTTVAMDAVECELGEHWVVIDSSGEKAPKLVPGR